MRKITIEEAVTTDEFEHFDEAFLPSIKKRYGDYLKARLHLDYTGSGGSRTWTGRASTSR